MKNINKVREKFKKGTLLLFILFVVIATKGFCAINDSNNNTYSRATKSPNKQTVEKDKVVLGIIEANQLKANGLFDNKINGLERQIQQTKEEIDKKFDYQMRCNEEAINSVNTSISGASYALTIIGIAVSVIGIVTGLLAIGLGLYISRQVKNAAHITKESRDILDTHLKIRDEVRELNKNIKSNMGKLYDDLRKEETRILMKRLCEVPEDIANLSDSLTSREIPKGLFLQMKKAYQSLLSSDIDIKQYKILYYILFFQHFADLSIFDEDLGNEIEARYGVIMSSCFKNDITKASEDFIKVTIKEGNILHFSEKIKKYFIALNQTKFRNYQELHKHIYNILCAKENRFNLYSILRSEDQLKDIAKIYGQYMLSDYKDTSGNTESEKNILTEIAAAEAATPAAGKPRNDKTPPQAAEAK